MITPARRSPAARSLGRVSLPSSTKAGRPPLGNTTSCSALIRLSSCTAGSSATLPHSATTQNDAPGDATRQRPSRGVSVTISRTVRKRQSVELQYTQVASTHATLLHLSPTPKTTHACQHIPVCPINILAWPATRMESIRAYPHRRLHHRPRLPTPSPLARAAAAIAPHPHGDRGASA